MENYRKAINGEVIDTDEQLLTLKEVIELCKISRSKIYSWMANGMFPPCHKTMQGTRWFKTDCEIWLNSTLEYFQETYSKTLKADYSKRNNQERAA